MKPSSNCKSLRQILLQSQNQRLQLRRLQRFRIQLNSIKTSTMVDLCLRMVLKLNPTLNFIKFIQTKCQSKQCKGHLKKLKNKKKKKLSLKRSRKSSQWLYLILSLKLSKRRNPKRSQSLRR